MSDTWLDKRNSDKLRISASQIETYRLCPRKWWLEKVRKLTAPSKGYFVFGTVLASVCERYMLADDLGYGPDGMPVNLYPPNWEKAFNKFTDELDGEISPADQDLIRRLVDKAIESGVLERKNGRLPEYEFDFVVDQVACGTCQGSGWVYDQADNLTKCPHCQGAGNIEVSTNGAIDNLCGDTVEDHKSTKKMRYAKSPKALADNAQMLVYGKVLLDKARADGRPVPDRVNLRHNVFCKDPGDFRVKKVEVAVSRKHIEDHWDRILSEARHMLHLRRTINRWHEIGDPPTGAQACNKYGGCPYISICAGRESEEGYAKRLDNHRNRTVQLTVQGNSTTGEASMTSFADRVQSASDGAQSQAPAPQMPQQQAPQMPQQQAPQMPQQQAPQMPQQQAPQMPQQQAPQPPSSGINPPQQQQPQGVFGQQPHNAPQFPPQQQAPQQQAPQQQAPQQQAPQQQGQPTAPPWADPTCVSCGGFGFDTRGNPCPICAEKARQNGRPLPSQFELSYPGDGYCHWRNRDMPNWTGFSQLPQGAAEIKASEQQHQHQSVQQPQQQQPQQQQIQPQAQPQPQAQQQAPQSHDQVEEVKPVKTEKKTRGRPEKGFTLVINAAVTSGSTSKGERKVVDLREVLRDVQQQISKDYGRDFYQIDPQQRRDIIASSADSIVENFGTSTVVVMGIGFEMSDLRALFDAVYPRAGFIISGSWIGSNPG